MSVEIEKRKGVVVLPINKIEGSTLYFFRIPPRVEDKKKKVESSELLRSARGLRVVGGDGLPGGGVEIGQSLLQAAAEEWEQEAGGVEIVGLADRLLPTMVMNIYQERPQPTDFDVTLFLLYLSEVESQKMAECGASLTMLDLLTGELYDAGDGHVLENIRPAHNDLLYYFAMIAKAYSYREDSYSYEQAVIA